MEAVDARLEAAGAFFALHFLGHEPAEHPEAPPPKAAPPTFEQLRDDLLRQAGGAYGLAEAAALLGISRQALHKRINADSALGMMLDKQIVVPKLQFVPRDDGLELVPGLREVLSVFREGKAPGLAGPPVPRRGRSEPGRDAAHRQTQGRKRQSGGPCSPRAPGSGQRLTRDDVRRREPAVPEDDRPGR